MLLGMTLGAAPFIEAQTTSRAATAPTIELRRVTNGKARYQVTFWAPDHDAGVAAAVAALRKHFPEGEVRGA
jgi:hypothetical protein